MDAQRMLELFDSPSRLFHLRGDGPIQRLWPEAWVAREELSRLSELRILCVSDDPVLDLDALVSRPVSLLTTLADGTHAARSGLVRQAERLGSDGALTRYRLTVAPWLWLATRQRHSRIFEAATVRDILARVLQAYQPYRHTVAADVDLYLSRLPARPYTTQYRETDYDFLDRLMAESGLGWTVEEDEEAPGGHRVRIFANSGHLPRDTQSARVGIRYARADGVQRQDTVQALVREQRRTLDRVTLLGWHGAHKRAVSGEALARPATGQEDELPGLEYYDVMGHDGLVNDAHAQHLARVIMESAQARADIFVGRGTVRGLRSGTRFELHDMPDLGPCDAAVDPPCFVLERVEHAGVNNLPGQTRQALARRLGAPDPFLTLESGLPEPGEYSPALGLVPLSAGPCHGIHAPFGVGEDDDVGGWLAWDRPGPGIYPDAQLLALAAQTGYANRFQAIPGQRPWRAPLPEARGARLAGTPTVHGVHSAIVVDEHGNTRPTGAREIYRNARGDVRIRFPWQDEPAAGAAHSRWARVAQRQAGAGQGMSFVPRIGQEVLVRLLDDDIDQPVVVGALYNGRGEGGVPATPGGKTAAAADRRAFAYARDHRPSARVNLSNGHAPAWHGASPEPQGHRNPAAFMGMKTKEFGGEGYSQAVFDDSDGQLRVQLKTTQAASELNLGHIIHQAGNYRGGLRGEGAELRTDGHGAVRGGAGVLLTTYHGTDPAEHVGELADGQRLADQALRQARAHDEAARAHQGVTLAAVGANADAASALGGFKEIVSATVSGEKLARAIADPRGEHRALEDRASTDRASRDRTLDHRLPNEQARPTVPGLASAGAGQVPHLGAPAIVMAARDGLAQAAGQHISYASGRVLHWGSGGDTHLAAMGALRVHSGQSLDILGGAQRAGAANTGLRLTSAHGDALLQAQRGLARVLAQKNVTVASQDGKVDYAAPKRIRIAVQGGASIVLEDGNITVTAPGKIEVKAGDRRFSGPDRLAYPLPRFNVCKECLLDALEGKQSVTHKR